MDEEPLKARENRLRDIAAARGLTLSACQALRHGSHPVSECVYTLTEDHQSGETAPQLLSIDEVAQHLSA
jgi:hypothetical protein